MIASVVVDLNIFGCRRSRRQAHVRNDRRKPPLAIRKGKSGDIEKRLEDIPAARNDCAAKSRIEKIFMRKAPGKDFTFREKSIRYTVLQFVRMSNQIHVV